MPGRGVPARVPKNTPDVSWTVPPEGFLAHAAQNSKARYHAVTIMHDFHLATTIKSSKNQISCG